MNKYENIINLQHYELKNHKRMSMESRAAQFSPFAALTGYSESIKETARLTKEKIILSEDMKSKLNMKLQIIEEHIKELPEINILYFVEDKKKSGGEYKEYTGKVRRIDKIEKKIVFVDKTIISLFDIVNIKANFIKEEITLMY